MRVVTSTHLRQHLASVMDEVCRDRAPVIVTHPSAEAVVMLPLDEYESIEATLHLLRSPRNAERPPGAVRRVEARDPAERTLDG
jgi:antitoxin YefM